MAQPLVEVKSIQGLLLELAEAICYGLIKVDQAWEGTDDLAYTTTLLAVFFGLFC